MGRRQKPRLRARGLRELGCPREGSEKTRRSGARAGQAPVSVWGSSAQAAGCGANQQREDDWGTALGLRTGSRRREGWRRGPPSAEATPAFASLLQRAQENPSRPNAANLKLTGYARSKLKSQPWSSDASRVSGLGCRAVSEKARCEESGSRRGSARRRRTRRGFRIRVPGRAAGAPHGAGRAQPRSLSCAPWDLILTSEFSLQPWDALLLCPVLVFTRNQVSALG